MTEVILALSNLGFGISILVYFYLREIKGDQVDKGRIEKELVVFKEVVKSKDDLMQKALLEYLKHNERLEKMVLPQPVTRKAVEEVLSHVPPAVPNEIEKNDKEIEQEQLEDLLKRIPVTKDTKIMFEGEENGIMSGPAEEIFGDGGDLNQAGLT